MPTHTAAQTSHTHNIVKTTSPSMPQACYQNVGLFDPQTLCFLSFDALMFKRSNVLTRYAPRGPSPTSPNASAHPSASASGNTAYRNPCSDAGS